MPLSPEPSTLEALDARHPVQRLRTPAGEVAFRRAGRGPALVLLHGIGSASGSWLRQIDSLSAQSTVLAWDAPGYGATTPVRSPQPVAADYGARVWDWLDALGLGGGGVTLVGHSLGALMAAAAAGQRPAAVRRLVLLAPARGYARAEPAERERRRDERLATLHSLGPAGMAQRRGAAMLSPEARADDLEWVRRLMAAVDPAGYTQATHLLAGGDLDALLAALPPEGPPVVVASGSADTITPPAACEAVARTAGCPYIPLGPAGHVCALEAAEAVNRLLAEPLPGETA